MSFRLLDLSGSHWRENHQIRCGDVGNAFIMANNCLERFIPWLDLKLGTERDLRWFSKDFYGLRSSKRRRTCCRTLLTFYIHLVAFPLLRGTTATFEWCTNMGEEMDEYNLCILYSCGQLQECCKGPWMLEISDSTCGILAQVQHWTPVLLLSNASTFLKEEKATVLRCEKEIEKFMYWPFFGEK
jgi:hypothetical protein